MTDGTALNGVAAAGTYSLSDFIVAASGGGGSLGSTSGGQYLASGFSTSAPYSFNWDGSAVTQWNKTGANTFNWWVFAETFAPNRFYVFGFEAGNVHTVNHATYVDFNVQNPLNVPSYIVSVGPSAPTTAVPEPSSMALVAAGIIALGIVRRRRSR